MPDRSPCHPDAYACSGHLANPLLPHCRTCVARPCKLETVYYVVTWLPDMGLLRPLAHRTAASRSRPGASAGGRVAAKAGDRNVNICLVKSQPVVPSTPVKDTWAEKGSNSAGTCSVEERNLHALRARLERDFEMESRVAGHGQVASRFAESAWSHAHSARLRPRKSSGPPSAAPARKPRRQTQAQAAPCAGLRHSTVEQFLDSLEASVQPSGRYASLSASLVRVHVVVAPGGSNNQKLTTA